jgi:hypothetical protein
MRAAIVSSALAAAMPASRSPERGGVALASSSRRSAKTTGGRPRLPIAAGHYTLWSQYACLRLGAAARHVTKHLILRLNRRRNCGRTELAR